MHSTHCKTKPFPLCKFNLVCNEYFSIVYKYAGMFGYFPAVRIQFRTSKKKDIRYFIRPHICSWYSLSVNTYKCINIHWTSTVHYQQTFYQLLCRSRGFAVLHILQCLQLSRHLYWTLSKSHCYWAVQTFFNLP